MHFMLVLYAGDYHNAWHRIHSGKQPTWHGHPFMVERFGKLSQHHKVTILTCKSQKPYEDTLPDGCRVIEVGLAEPFKQHRELVARVASEDVTHLMIRAPIPGLIRWATRQQNLRTIAALAQSYSNKTLKGRLKNWRYARLFNHPKVEWVFNHNINSSYSLQSIGVNPAKIVPWDWPQTWLDRKPKVFPEQSGSEPWTIFFVGSVIPNKGVGDGIDAVARLRHAGINIQFKIAGKGDIAGFQQQAETLGISDAVIFLGMIGNNEVIDYMTAADLVLISSRHNYPEGFPYTINQALLSRTPIIASDHPMFKGILQHRESAMIFPAGDGGAIAHCIQEVIASPSLYESLSRNSQSAWEFLQVPVRWGDVIDRWLGDTPGDRQWLAAHSLQSGRYADRVARLNN
ncbi:MAG: glycosyltransferase [Spirulina sp. DLM2.Bin59]|nr:MAG: glycosyltransferase [Spirulina sp. DLM2.Bin59]